MGKRMQHLLERLESRRFLDAGQLDTTFGTGGHTILGANHSLGEIDLGLTPEDQIVVTAADDEGVRVWQLTRDGKVDSTFGPLGDGTFTVPAIKANDSNGQPASIAQATVVADDGS